MSEHFKDFYITVDASADLAAQVGGADGQYIFDNVETTNMASGGIKERKPTLSDLQVSVTWSDPTVDESSATSMIKVLYDGSVLGGGDGLYTVVVQKVSSGGTGGAATTADPTYTFTAVIDAVPIFTGDVASLVNQGATTTFSNASATITRATS